MGNNKAEYNFSDKQKEGKWFLREAEDRFRNKIIPHVPRFIETYHLTWMTLLWSLLIILFGFLAKDNINWMWIVSLMIFFQYLTDLFDGALGRYRNTGLVKWGYYMDHFLDYIFLASIIIAYSMLFPPNFALLFIFVFVLAAGFLVSVYLAAVSGKIKISFLNFGPTEGRIFFILLNTLLVIFGVTMAQKVLPFILVGEIIFLCVMVYKTQRNLWKEDMEIKAENKN